MWVSTALFLLSPSRPLQPRLRRTMLCLECLDLAYMLQGQADVVQSIQQTMLAKGVHLKIIRRAVRRSDGLPLQIDLQFVANIGFHCLEQRIHLLRSQADRQQAVLEAVVEKNVGETRRDDGAETVIFQRPRRVLARTAAAEIFARQQNLRTPITRLVQHKIRIQWTLAVIHARLAVIQITPFVERIRAETGALDRLQELLGNDCVSIDIGAIQRRDQAVEQGKFLHYLFAAFSSFSPPCWISLPRPSMVLQPARNNTARNNATALIVISFSINTHIDKMPGNRGGRRHLRVHQMGAPARPPPPLEIAVGSRSATLARREPVVVHRQTHRATRIAPRSEERRG